MAHTESPFLHGALPHMDNADNSADSIATMMDTIGRAARDAARFLARASHIGKQRALMCAADHIESAKADLIAANKQDIQYGQDKGLSKAALDRLLLTPERIADSINSVRVIAAQPDPVGQEMHHWTRPNGLDIRRVRTPLGVIGVIYESRPNVTGDAGALCLKSGNAVILRSGSDSFHSSACIHACLVQGLVDTGFPCAAIQFVPTRARSAVQEMLTMNRYIDVLVPRGGRDLVALVQQQARVPVFAHLEGICHMYLSADANLAKARTVAVNAKTRRPGICGALECLLIDRAFLAQHGAVVIQDMLDQGVEVRADDAALVKIAGVKHATDADFGHEFLDLVLAVKVVDGIDSALAHIGRYGSGHTDCIITENAAEAARFFAHLDSAIVMHNASTQFADGGEFGMGAEIGIATGKMHARGPIGAEQLTSFKYIVRGQGAHGACRP